jgi:hypothetical protein
MVRRAMDQTTWEAAENEIREWIRAGKIGAVALQVVRSKRR